MKNEKLKINDKKFPDESLEPLPHMHPHIRISPFIPTEWEKLLKTKVPSSLSVKPPQFWLNDGYDCDFCLSGRDALLACLLHLKLQRGDEVLIVKTTDGPYVTSCVTKTIEKVCRWTLNPSPLTQLILVIHEFGFPCPREKVVPYQKKGIPILEDCAYALGSRIEGAPIGTFGDYALYSLPKYYPIPFGGVLAWSKKMKVKTSVSQPNADEVELLRNTVHHARPFLKEWNKIQRANWQYFAKALSKHGFSPYFDLKKEVVPGVFLMKVSNGFAGEDVKKRLNAAGVESTQYYNQGGFYFPVHQFLTEWEKEYIVRWFLGKS